MYVCIVKGCFIYFVWYVGFYIIVYFYIGYEFILNVVYYVGN